MIVIFLGELDLFLGGNHEIILTENSGTFVVNIGWRCPVSRKNISCTTRFYFGTFDVQRWQTAHVQTWLFWLEESSFALQFWFSGKFFCRFTPSVLEEGNNFLCMSVAWLTASSV